MCSFWYRCVLGEYPPFLSEVIMLCIIKTRLGKDCKVEVPCQRVADVLQNAAIHRNRLRLWYGDVTTGIAWNDFHDVKGTIGFSTGVVTIPLLIARTSSSGGGGILTKRIVRIDDIKSKTTLYKHPSFAVKLDESDLGTLSERDIKFLKGEIYG